MALLKLDNVKKYYGDKLVLDIDDLEILENERIGICWREWSRKDNPY